MNQPYLIYNTLSDAYKPDDFHGDYHVHLLCKAGRMDFTLNGKPQAIQAGDLLIWQMTTDFEGITYSDDFDAEYLMVSSPFLLQYNPEQVWATKGYMYIKANPVFHLEEDEWDVIETDFLQFRQRISATRQLFTEEIVGSLVRILLYDMWNIYSREIEKSKIEDITSRHYMRFLMAVQENCRAHREVAWYGSRLNLAPKYLSEISKDITGRPASDWIESYTAQELVKLLNDQALTLTQIVDEMHFSSQAMLTRYLKRTLGKTPSEYRKGLKRDRQADSIVPHI